MMKPPPFLFVVVFVLAAQTCRADSVHEKIRAGLPKFDPAVRAESAAPENAPASRDVPAREATSPETPTVVAENSRPVVLPEVVVTAENPKREPTKVLPRVETRPAPGKVKLEPFLSPEERDARLEDKHLSVLDRKVLNRFTLFRYGASARDRAREAEAIERGARGLNEVACQIEAAQLAGADPEYLRNLERIYYQMYLSRPK